MLYPTDFREDGDTMNDFSKNVYLAVQKIPRGKVTNYGCIAFLAGKPRAARGVGFVLHRNPDPVRIPCHRVVFKDGSLCAGYVFGGPDVQRALLAEEGVAFLPDAGSAQTKRSRSDTAAIRRMPYTTDTKQANFRFF